MGETIIQRACCPHANPRKTDNRKKEQFRCSQCGSLSTFTYPLKWRLKGTIHAYFYQGGFQGSPTNAVLEYVSLYTKKELEMKEQEGI